MESEKVCGKFIVRQQRGFRLEGCESSETIFPCSVDTHEILFHSASVKPFVGRCHFRVIHIEARHQITADLYRNASLLFKQQQEI